MKNEYDWIKSKFTAADLKDKTVHFKAPGPDGKILERDGTFDAAQDSRGWIRVALLYHEITPDRGAIVGGKMFIPADFVANIVRNPPGSKCEFSFIAA